MSRGFFWAYWLGSFVVAWAVIASFGALVRTLMGRTQPPDTPLPPLSEWFAVEFDEERVTLRAQPPGEEPWVQSFLWSEVTRVCFKSEDIAISDGIYIFTTQRPESFVVPTEAKGGAELWGRIVGRGLFPEELMVRAATLPEGELLCWPAVEQLTAGEMGRC